MGGRRNSDDLSELDGNSTGLAGSPAVWSEARDRFARLTNRERDVLMLIAQGRTNKEAAAQLGCSPRTTEIYRHHGRIKLGARTVCEAVRIAVYAALARDSDDL